MSGRAPAALVALALLALVLAVPAGASSGPPRWPDLPALPFPHLRDGNNTTGNGTDTTPPSITVTSHRDGETVRGAGITLRGTSADDRGVRSVEVSVNGGPWAAASGNLTWAAPVKLEEGPNTLYLRATDLDGNVARQNISLVLDTSTRNNSGILLAAAVIIPVVAVLVLLAVRRRPAPADEAPKDHEKLEKDLGLEGKPRDATGAELDDSEEVTRLDEAPAPKGRAGERP